MNDGADEEGDAEIDFPRAPGERIAALLDASLGQWPGREAPGPKSWFVSS